MGILQDPVMQSILQQAKGDPAALQEHMRNAGIRFVHAVPYIGRWRSLAKALSIGPKFRN